MCVFFLFFFLSSFRKTYVVGTHLSCSDKLMLFKWVPTTCLYKEVDKNYTGYHLKTMKLLDCVLIGVCVVIRSNTVYEQTCLSK